MLSNGVSPTESTFVSLLAAHGSANKDDAIDIVRSLIR
jgi:hypothetical protein